MGVKAGRVSRTVIRPQPGFRAELPGLDLPTLIQMTCARRERQVVRVSSYGEEGFLYSSEGRIVHATLGTLVGDEAVLRMLGWSTGDFAICDRPFPAHPTVESSTEGLLLLAAQRSDEAAGVMDDESMGEDAEGDEPTVLHAPTPPPVRISRPPTSLPPVDLSGIAELPRRRSEPPRPSVPPPPPPRALHDVIASVRIDARGEVRAKTGGEDQLAPLVAYIHRIASLVQADFALDPFDALHAELAGKRVLVYREHDELVGVVLRPGPAAQTLRQKHGV